MSLSSTVSLASSSSTSPFLPCHLPSTKRPSFDSGYATSTSTRHEFDEPPRKILKSSHSASPAMSTSRSSIPDNSSLEDLSASEYAPYRPQPSRTNSTASFGAAASSDRSVSPARRKSSVTKIPIAAILSNEPTATTSRSRESLPAAWQQHSPQQPVHPTQRSPPLPSPTHLLSKSPFLPQPQPFQVRPPTLPRPPTSPSAPNEIPSIRDLACPHCSLIFLGDMELRDHLRHQCQEKHYVCSTCHARFRRLNDLDRHQRIHTGERPHLCDICGRRFSRATTLKRHRQGVEGCAGRRADLGMRHSNMPRDKLRQSSTLVSPVAQAT